jgi:hypothetical protein
MIITPEDFKNDGEVDCCTRAKGLISLRFTGKIKLPDQFEQRELELGNDNPDYSTVAMASGIYEAYCHEFTPGSRKSKDVVLKRGTLAEVVGCTNEKCGLNDKVALTAEQGAW